MLTFTDQHQDIARSGYADMLNDDERNRAYDAAIRANVNYLVNSEASNPSGNKHFHCGDIGTGSGLLSMMIVRAFRENNYENFDVTAFESFGPMANCARDVIESNGMSKYINVINARSDQAPTLPKFDLLVAELLDTELIGEGCLEIYRHAIENLCSPKCLYIPHEARIYIEPVASTFLFSRHHVIGFAMSLDSYDRMFRLLVPGYVQGCVGIPKEIDDMQVSMLQENTDFIRVCQPKVAFSFTFNDISTLKLNDCSKIQFQLSTKLSQPPVIIMWWDIIMYDKQIIDSCYILGSELDRSLDILSCAPTWARSLQMKCRDKIMKETYGRSVWREHWIQGVYCLTHMGAQWTKAEQMDSLASEDVGLDRHDVTSDNTTDFQDLILTVYANHDSHSLWFDVKPPSDSFFMPTCECNKHRTMSKPQLSYLSGSELRELIADSLSGTHITCYPVVGELKFTLRKFEGIFLTDWIIELIARSGKKINTLYYMLLDGDIPWKNFSIALRQEASFSKLIDFIKLKFALVQFEDLSRTCTRVVNCEGFNMKKLDEMIEASSKIADSNVESFYLWEYKTKRIGLDMDIISGKAEMFRENKGIKGAPVELVICDDLVKAESTGLALAFWIDIKLKRGGDITTGPTSPRTSIGQPITWTRFHKQPVHFLHDLGYLGDFGKVTISISIDDEANLIINRTFC